MKQIITLLLVLMFQVDSHAQSMVKNGNDWYYMAVGWADWYYQDGIQDDSHKVYSMTSLDRYIQFDHFFVNGERIIGGKTYQEIWRESRLINTIYNWFNPGTYVSTPPHYMISLREEGERVYVNKEEYDRFTEFFLPIIYQYGLSLEDIMPLVDNEYVLYDFSIEHCDSVVQHIGSAYYLLYPQLCYYNYHPKSGPDEWSMLSRFCSDGQIKYDEIIDSYPNPFFPGERMQDLFPTGTKWEEVLIANTTDGTDSIIETDVYEVGPDTMVNGIYYKAIYKNEDLQTYLLRETQGKVWLKTDEYYEDVCIYDFTQLDNFTNQTYIQHLYVKHTPEAFLRFVDYDRSEYLDGYVVDAEYIHPTITHISAKNDENGWDSYNDSNGTIVVGMGRIEATSMDACMMGYLNETSQTNAQGHDVAYRVNWVERDGKRIFTYDDYDLVSHIAQIQLQNSYKSTAIYNLQGLRILRPQRGLNIVGGRKVWVK